jgi:hypothetical protein
MDSLEEWAEGLMERMGTAGVPRSRVAQSTQVGSIRFCCTLNEYRMSSSLAGLGGGDGDGDGVLQLEGTWQLRPLKAANQAAS